MKCYKECACYVHNKNSARAKTRGNLMGKGQCHKPVLEGILDEPIEAQIGKPCPYGLGR